MPRNIIKGQGGNIGQFADGDVIYSLINSDAKIARLVSGNYSFEDKSGVALGTIKVEPRQKLGVITRSDMTGVYYKVAPEYKRHAFIAYDKIYKLG